MGDPDQTPRPVASDLGLLCLPMSHKKETRLIWVKTKSISEKEKQYILEIITCDPSLYTKDHPDYM